MVGPEESRGELTMLSIEGTAGQSRPVHVHDDSHSALFVLDGRVRVSLDGDEHLLTPGDCASIPAGSPYGYVFEGRVNRLIAMNA